MVKQKCARVSYLEPSGPAFQGGLRPGDCIVAVNDIQVRSARDLVATVERANPGQRLTMSLEDGRELTVTAEARTAERSRRFCDYLKKQRTIIVVMGGENIAPAMIVLKAPMTLGEFLKQFNYPRPSRIVHGYECGADGAKPLKPPIKEPTLNVVLHNADQVDFFPARPKGLEETGRTY